MWKKRIELKDEDRVIKNPEWSEKKTFDRAVNLLTYRPRSIEEMRGRLLEKAWTNQEIVDAVIEKLRKYNYLDDLQFAKDFAAAKLRERPVGKRRLRLDMIRKKLDQATIDRALADTFDEIPEDVLIDRAIAKRLRLKGNPKDRSDQKKFFDYLMRLGFDYDIIRDKMRQVSSMDFEEEY